MPSPTPSITLEKTEITLSPTASIATPAPKVIISTSPTPSPSDTHSITILPNEFGFVRLRDGPTISAGEIGQLPTGSSYPYQQKNYGWYQIEVDGKKGWVSGIYVEEK